MMPFSFRNTLKRILLTMHWRVAHTTEFDVLERFFASIKPISTNHALIRIGGDADGGYLIPNDLIGIQACFSPGVSTVSDFELDLARRGIECFLADYSVDRPPINHNLFHFEKKYLGPIEDSTYTTLENWVQRNAPDQKEMILQMDIEGGEYGVLFDTSSQMLRKFRILVIEFHRLCNLCDKTGFELINLAFKKLLKDFYIVHIHPNNRSQPLIYGKFSIPSNIEFTFLRKDRVTKSWPTTSFPHPLDRRNVINRNTLALPECWYRA